MFSSTEVYGVQPSNNKIYKDSTVKVLKAGIVGFMLSCINIIAVPMIIIVIMWQVWAICCYFIFWFLTGLWLTLQTAFVTELLQKKKLSGFLHWSHWKEQKEQYCGVHRELKHQSVFYMYSLSELKCQGDESTRSKCLIRPFCAFPSGVIELPSCESHREIQKQILTLKTNFAVS